MDFMLNLFTCILESIIFDTFFKETMHRKYANIFYNLCTYCAAIMSICFINSFNNSKLNLVANVIVYFLISIFLFEASFKEKLFCYIIFYTVFAGIEIIFEFGLYWVVGEKYNWLTQSQLFKFTIICLEKLSTFIVLLVPKRKLSRKKYEMNNKPGLFTA